MQLCLPARLSANMSIHSYFWQITCLSLFYYSYYYFHITQHLLFKANQLQSHLVCKQNCHMATKKAFDERPTVCVCMCHNLNPVGLFIICCLDCVDHEWNVNNNLKDCLCGCDSQQQQQQQKKT